MSAQKYKSLLFSFQKETNISKLISLATKLAPLIITSTREKDLWKKLEKLADDETPKLHFLVKRFIKLQLCPNPSTGLYIDNFRENYGYIYKPDTYLHNLNIFHSPKSKFGRGPLVMKWDPIEEVNFHDLSHSPNFRNIHKNRPKQIIPLLYVQIFDVKGLIHSLDSLNRNKISEADFLFIDDSMLINSISENEYKMISISVKQMRFKSCESLTFKITLNIQHWRRILQNWNPKAISVAHIEIFNNNICNFYVETNSSLLFSDLKLKKLEKLKPQKVTSLKLKISEFSYEANFNLKLLRKCMKTVANFTKKNSNTFAAIKIITTEDYNEIHLVNYNNSNSKLLHCSTKLDSSVYPESPLIYVRDFYKLLLGTRTSHVKILWGHKTEKDSIAITMNLGSKYKWLNNFSSKLLNGIRPDAKSKEFNFQRQSKAFERCIEEYLTIQRRRHGAGLRKYVAGSRAKEAKFNKWKRTKVKDYSRVDEDTGESEFFPKYVAIWEFIYVKEFPFKTKRKMGFLLTRKGQFYLKERIKLDSVKTKFEKELLEWKIFAREFLAHIVKYAKEQNKLAFDYSIISTEEFSYPLSYPDKTLPPKFQYTPASILSFFQELSS